MTDRALVGTVCVLAGFALASCGANAQPHTVALSTTTAPPVAGAPSSAASKRAHTFIAPPADAIVTMRRFSPVSLMWQTIFVEPDGRGLLTSLIGETAGAPHRGFRLSPPQLARLRRLIAGARTVRPGPGKPGDYLYTLHIRGEAQLSFEGPMPRRLSALVDYLDGLTLAYCC
jgi:hypothetical protein